MKLSDDLSYEELLQRLSIDLPTVLPGFVPSSLGGSSGSVSQPGQGSTLVWDASQQLYVPYSAKTGVTANAVAGPFTWTGSYSAFVSTSITVGNPLGATVLAFGTIGGYATVSGYCTIGIQVDSGAWAPIGGYYFNATLDHRLIGPFPALLSLPAGVHTISIGGIEGTSSPVASMVSNTADGAWVTAQEIH